LTDRRQQALLPGAPEARCEAEYRREGAAVGLEDAEMLRATAREYGVALPASLAAP